tara:strand:- start:149 stop:397 length:249 start_codon:yes stop_codon:yes gene_type:complete
MNDDYLFAVDLYKHEVLVSESSTKGNKISFVERIKKNDNETIFNAVVTLKSITDSSDFDNKTFKLMDKICQVIYKKHKESKT